MKAIVFLLLSIIIPVWLFSQEDSRFVVVELFTSEGDKQCIIAGDLIKDLSLEYSTGKVDVYFLSYHVDYWNKLGWKDPFSKFQYTRRQENYSRVLPSKEMYTPQIIVNGTQEFTLSEANKIRSAINNGLTNPTEIPLKLNLDSLNQDTAYVSWTLSKESNNQVLQLAYTENGLSSKVEKGENAGKTLLHDFVVRVFSATNNPGLSGRVKLYLKDRDMKKSGEIIGFIQQKQNYKITGAARIRLK